MTFNDNFDLVTKVINFLQRVVGQLAEKNKSLYRHMFHRRRRHNCVVVKTKSLYRHNKNDKINRKSLHLLNVQILNYWCEIVHKISFEVSLKNCLATLTRKLK